MYGHPFHTDVVSSNNILSNKIVYEMRERKWGQKLRREREMPFAGYDWH